MTLHKHCPTADRVDLTGSQFTETEFKQTQAIRLHELNNLKNITKKSIPQREVCLNQRQLQNQR